LELVYSCQATKSAEVDELSGGQQQRVAIARALPSTRLAYSSTSRFDLDVTLREQRAASCASWLRALA